MQGGIQELFSQRIQRLQSQLAIEAWSSRNKQLLFAYLNILLLKLTDLVGNASGLPIRKVMRETFLLDSELSIIEGLVEELYHWSAEQIIDIAREERIPYFEEKLVIDQRVKPYSIMQTDDDDSFPLLWETDKLPPNFWPQNMEVSKDWQETYRLLLNQAEKNKRLQDITETFTAVLKLDSQFRMLYGMKLNSSVYFSETVLLQEILTQYGRYYQNCLRNVDNHSILCLALK